MYPLARGGQYFDKCKASPTRIRIFSITEIFFVRFSLPSTRKGSFWAPKRQVSTTPASRLRLDGRKRRFSNTMMPYITYYKHYACSMQGMLQAVRRRAQNDSNTQRVDALFLKMEKKSLRFQKHTDTSG